MPAAPPSLRAAASVLLCRRGPGGLELFWVRRAEQLRSGGGFWAFPGGRVDRSDAALPVQSPAPLSAPLSESERCAVAAAARELFEEAGVLAVPSAERCPDEERRRVRLELLGQHGAGAGAAEGDPFGALLRRHGLSIDAALFHPAGRWVTPPSVGGNRYDARFYLVELPAGAQAEVWPGELAEGAWIAPAAALARWDEGTALLHPPAWHSLKCLAEPEPARGDGRAALPDLRDPSRPRWRLPIRDFIVERMEFQRGLTLVPQRTVTLPPATHTNTLLVGEERLLVVDPGSCYPEEQAALERQLELLAGLGRRADAILLTHHHPDHVDGAMPLAARFGLGILAHEQTAARISDRVRIDGLVADGDRLPYGRHGLEVLHLPGHTQGHLCLLEPGSRAVVAGDLVAGTGTVIIDPPEGSMADYCASLRRLLAREPGTVYPAHGPVAPAGVQLLAGTLAHRLQREEKVRAALAARAGPALPRELVAAVYGDVDPSLHGFAERSLLAHLEKLATDGRARVVGDRFEAA